METVETVADFIFLGSSIIADGDCSDEGEGVGRGEGGGFRMGGTGVPVADSFRCLAELIQYCKV